MQLNYYVVPDQKMVQKGEHIAVMSEEMLFIKVTQRSADRLQMTETLRHCSHILIEESTCKCTLYTLISIFNHRIRAGLVNIVTF